MTIERFSDEILGELTLVAQLDGQHAEYKAQVKIATVPATLYLYSDPRSGDMSSSVSIGRNLVTDFERFSTILKSHLIQEFMPRLSANTGVFYSHEKVLGELVLDNITVHANGTFSFGFRSCSSLDDHSLVVYFTDDGTVECCDIVG